MLLGKVEKIGGNDTSAKIILNIVEKSKDAQGNKVETTIVVPVYFFGKLAEIATKYLKPEGLIFLECKIQNNMELVATELKFLPSQREARPTQYGKTTVSYRPIAAGDTPIPF